MQQAGRLKEARHIFERSLAVLGKAGDTNREPSCRGNLGFVLWLLGDLDAAQRELDRAVADLGGESAEAAASIFVTFSGFVRYDSGDVAGAAARFESALRLARGGESDVARARVGQGLLAAARGEWPRSDALFREALEMQMRIGEHVVAASTRALHARALLDNGKYAMALAQARQAANEASRFRALPVQALALATAGEALVALRRGSEAVDAVADARRTAASVDDYAVHIRVAQSLAKTLSGDADRRRILEDALRRASEAKNVPLELDVRLAMMELAPGAAASPQLKALATEATDRGLLAIAARALALGTHMSRQ